MCSSLRGRSRRVPGVSTPCSSRRWPRPPVSMTPQPVRTEPGSTPRITTRAPARAPVAVALLRGRFLHLLLGDIEVGPHVLHVVVVLEGLHELQALLGLLALEHDQVLGVLADFRLLGFDPRSLDD